MRRRVSAMRFGTMKIDGIPVDVIAVDPSTIGEVLNIKPSEGAFEALATTNGLLVSENALETGVVGSTVMLEFPQDPGGTFEIVGTFEEDIFGQYIITHETYAVGFNNPFDEITLANIASGVSFEEGRAAVEAVATDYPTVTVQTKAETVAETEQQIDQLLALFPGCCSWPSSSRSWESPTRWRCR